MSRIAETHGWRRSARLLRLDIDSRTAFAFDCLEARGFRFLVHYGVKNAEDLAIGEWFKELEGTD